MTARVPGRKGWLICSSGIEAVADASGSKDEFEIFVSMGLLSGKDSMGAPHSSHGRGVGILQVNGECTGTFHPSVLWVLTEEANGVSSRAWCEGVEDPQSCA